MNKNTGTFGHFMSSEAFVGDNIHFNVENAIHSELVEVLSNHEKDV